MDDPATRGTSDLIGALRVYLMAGGAIAGAGILAASLVAALPEPDRTRSLGTTVQLSSNTSPSLRLTADLFEQAVTNLLDEASAAAPVPSAAAAESSDDAGALVVDSSDSIGAAATLSPIEEVFTRVATIVSVIVITPIAFAFIALIWVVSQIQGFFYSYGSGALAAATVATEPESALEAFDALPPDVPTDDAQKTTDDDAKVTPLSASDPEVPDLETAAEPTTETTDSLGDTTLDPDSAEVGDDQTDLDEEVTEGEEASEPVAEEAEESSPTEDADGSATQDDTESGTDADQSATADDGSQSSSADTPTSSNTEDSAA